ncbi:MAG: MBL fold metallo-hydrolase [Spirochaetes bacterium]|jgi:glyoxylase-like metal-dependent hydrolase (beta-lactamase superfamily II)|nr:MBL fold metallo-hydrolase [Spirochaetota bacterium]
MRITSHIFQVGGSDESHTADASIYLIVSNNEAALVDAGTGKGHDEVIENIRAAGVTLENIRYLFLTHCHYDHTGGINEILNAAGSGCKTVAHELDAVYIEEGNSTVTAASWYGTFIKPAKIDIKVKGREAEFKVGGMDIKFHHTPGHSPGSSVLTLVSGGKLVLFGQDVHGPLNDTILSNRRDYIKSLEFMISLEADILCEGHFGVITGKEKVKRFIESFL